MQATYDYIWRTLGWQNPLNEDRQWEQNVFTSLRNPLTTPKNILDALSINSTLLNYYQKDAGVAEQYTVGQHTEMVLEMALRYRASLSPKVTPLISWDEFLLFLALHDIGKGVAKEEYNASESNLTFKQLELEKTRGIVDSVASALGIIREKRDIFLALLLYDSQGDYLQFEIQIDVIKKHIEEMAETCGKHPVEFYDLYQAFHMVDAGSYPRLKIFFAIDGNVIQYCEGYQSMIEALTNELRK